MSLNLRIRMGSIELKNLVDILYFLLLFQCIMYPKYNMVLKALTIAFIMIMIIAQQRGKLIFNQTIILWGFYLLFNIVSTLQGAINGHALEAFRRGTVNIIWPLTYFLFSGYRLSTVRLMNLYRGIVFITGVACIVDTLLIISDLFGLSGVRMCLEWVHLGGFSSVSTYVLFRSDHIFLYAFLTPFMIAALTMNPIEIERSGMRLRLVKLIAVYSVVIGFFTGMGAIWLSVFITAVLCIGRSGMLKRRQSVFFLILLFIPAICFILMSVRNNGMVYHILKEVNSRAGIGEVIDSGSIIRRNQIVAMIKEWVKHPILGSGIASTVGYIRDGHYIETSAFESSYFIILYQKGIVGFILFFAMVIQGIKGLKKRVDAHCLSESFLMGMLGFLIANAFNPYLASLSTIWIMFLPLLIGNTETNENDVNIKREGLV